MSKPDDRFSQLRHLLKDISTGVIPIKDLGGSYDMTIEGNQNIQVANAIFNLPEPISVKPDDLRELIVAFREVVPPFLEVEEGYHFDEIAQKNVKNKMDENYFQLMVVSDLPYFSDIDEFLRDPRSNEYVEMYNNTALDLQMQYLGRPEKFPNIHSFLAYSYATIFMGLQDELGGGRGKIRTFLHHMYWKCSIGVK